MEEATSCIYRGCSERTLQLGLQFHLSSFIKTNMRERNAIIAMIRYSIFSTVAFMLRQATQNEKFLKLFISFILSIATFMFNGKIISFADGSSVINSVTISFHNTILYINYSLFFPATTKKAELITNLFTMQVSFLLLSLLPACWTSFIFRLFHCFAIFQVFVVFLVKKKSYVRRFIITCNSCRANKWLTVAHAWLLLAHTNKQKLISTVT